MRVGDVQNPVTVKGGGQIGPGNVKSDDAELVSSLPGPSGQPGRLQGPVSHGDNGFQRVTRSVSRPRTVRSMAQTQRFHVPASLMPGTPRLGIGRGPAGWLQGILLQQMEIWQVAVHVGQARAGRLGGIPARTASPVVDGPVRHHAAVGLRLSSHPRFFCAIKTIFAWSFRVGRGTDAHRGGWRIRPTGRVEPSPWNYRKRSH
jgi:hypothetical protein